MVNKMKINLFVLNNMFGLTFCQIPNNVQMKIMIHLAFGDRYSSRYLNYNKNRFEKIFGDIKT